MAGVNVLRRLCMCIVQIFLYLLFRGKFHMAILGPDGMSALINGVVHTQSICGPIKLKSAG